MFLGRACIIFIFLNLPVPGFAEITRTTISEKLSSNFCELKIRRGRYLEKKRKLFKLLYLSGKCLCIFRATITTVQYA